LPQDGLWQALDHPGLAPCWRASLHYTEIGEPPVVEELILEWSSIPTSAQDAGSSNTIALHDPTPNPCNPGTKIRFELPDRCHVLVEILGSSGRRLRTLVNTELPAGTHQMIWDGRTSEGEPLGSGIYILRVHAAGFEESRKLALIR
jgi:hypothetical protein